MMKNLFFFLHSRRLAFYSTETVIDSAPLRSQITPSPPLLPRYHIHYISHFLPLGDFGAINSLVCLREIHHFVPHNHIDTKTFRRVKGVDVKEALRLQKENNFVISDVRPEAEYKDGHPPGAINVEMYRLIREWTPWDIARHLGSAFFGIFSGTE
uniref:Rhodanese domain-containing protein n=1 Tax=Brassica campestris TaxID=3711 RepID=M4D0V5_BRACM